ncbi:MAG: FG-GAP repeat protein, partial [Nannocystaceae bacterium]
MNRFQATCYTLACALAGTVVLPTTLAHAADDTPVVAPTRYANDLFGGSMAVDGDTLLVGAAGSSEYAFHTGEVHVFHSSAGAWNKVDSIGPEDPASTVLFGQSLALSGEHAMVTSWDNSKNQAVLDFFHRTNLRWEAVAQLRSSRFADFTVDNDLAVVATYERTILLEWVATHWREKTVLPATFESVALSGEALLLA